MRKIPIKHKGETLYAIVDNKDYKRLSKIRWNIVNGYARTQFVDDSGKTVVIPMHSFINNTYGQPRNGNLETDHINGNRLDNRKDNLRTATRSQNMANKVKQKRNSSGFKGVYWNNGGWQSTIGYDHKIVYIGRFKNKVEAAKAYDVKARKLYGEYAHTNF